MGGVAAYPGSFDPPTVAHLALAEAARRQVRLERVDLVLSRQPLGKDRRGPSVEERAAVLEKVAAARPWLGVRIVEARLVADVAAGYDAVIMGADKWAQVVDPAWYGGSAERRDQALARLPRVLVAPRDGSPPPDGLPEGALVLELHAGHAGVSSTLARAGRSEWVLPEALASGLWAFP
ncbi:MAG TPA: hypothetical protein VKU88_06440 [Acidimicrobiales bacterium]|nr:hypothetical protein [Acidimicrobiales bacterium]